MKQRVLHELREAWNRLVHWELPSFDDLRSQTSSKTPTHQSSMTLNLSGLGRAGGEHRRSVAKEFRTGPLMTPTPTLTTG